MKKYSKNEKEEIINNVINLFMNEWDDAYYRNESGIEYKLPDGKIIEIEICDPESSDYPYYDMKIDLHDPREGHMTRRYNSCFTVGKLYSSDYDRDIDWKCDDLVETYIRIGINEIFKGLETEKD